MDEPETSKTSEKIDATGLICPAPVLRARQVLAGMRTAEVLEIHTDDPMAELDFQLFCDRTGHRLESSSERGGVRITRIRKRESGSLESC